MHQYKRCHKYKMASDGRTNRIFTSNNGNEIEINAKQQIKEFQSMLISNRKLSENKLGIYLTNHPQTFDQ